MLCVIYQSRAVHNHAKGNWNLVFITYQGLQLNLNDGFGKDFTTVAYILVFNKVSVLCITISTFIIIQCQYTSKVYMCMTVLDVSEFIHYNGVFVLKNIIILHVDIIILHVDNYLACRHNLSCCRGKKCATLNF